MNKVYCLHRNTVQCHVRSSCYFAGWASGFGVYVIWGYLAGWASGFGVYVIGGILQGGQVGLGCTYMGILLCGIPHAAVYFS